MGNPFDAIDLRLAGIEKLLGHISSAVAGQYLEKIEDTISLKEAAKILCLSPNTIYTKTHKKIIPHSKQGKLLMFSRKDLAEYIAKGKVKTTADVLEEAESYRVKKLTARG